MSLNIYTGNRLENLIEALAGVVQEPQASALTPEIIVVQSKGMQRWVAMELARRFGVWANCAYPFPNALIEKLFGLYLPELPDTELFSREVLTWKITGLLPLLLPRAGFEPLSQYLTNDRDGLKRFQLAQKIADVFDQYTIFRPALLQDWEKPEKSSGLALWQATLWREIVANSPGIHRGRLREEFLRRLKSGAPPIGPLPQRIAVFGISFLPAYHLEILAAIAPLTEVNLFLLSPTREYWSDIISRREKARLTPGKNALRSEGHPLLASLGRLGRDFSDMIIEMSDWAAIQADLYVDPGRDCCLHQIQSDILNLTISNDDQQKRPLNPDDLSVQLHSCHSPLREIEVLHDNILFLMENYQGLTPRDILVMTPDIEAYAPYIAAVFAGAPEAPVKIPYSIADRRLKNEGQIAQILLKLLDLAGGRFTVGEVLDILTAQAVSQKFGLENDEITVIRNWISKTAICWGIDEQSRHDLGLPGYRENSWMAGLERLLLGYALPEEEGRLFQGKLPFDDVEGSSAPTLGKLLDYIGKLAAAAANLSRPRTLEEWKKQCLGLLEDFIATDNDDLARELSAIQAILSHLDELGRLSGLTEKVTLGVIRSWLIERLEQEEKGLGFLTGGVTFCAMLPMRSIPFRVVALVGMNDGVFPRRNPAPGFDLMAQKPRRGDRCGRDEDRYLFLEALLSARDCLYISYIGQSIKDNSVIPPSVLVSELIDTVDRGFAAEEGASSAQRLVRRHRLQAFSRDYFSRESPLFSYSADNYGALLARQSAVKEAEEFMTVPLALPAGNWQEITIQNLLRFFDNPARYFLENRLDIRLTRAVAALDEREPFALVGLDAYQLKKELLQIALRGDNPQEYLPVARCRGIIPPAGAGTIVFDRACGETVAFNRILQDKFSGNQPLPPLDFELEAAGCRLYGRLDGIRPSVMIRYRLARMKAKDRFRAWIEHIILNVLQKPDYPRRTELIMSDKTDFFAPVENAADLLRDLLNLYRQGLTLPLRFFPASSMAYAEKQEWNIGKARGQWEEGYNTPGEGSDAYYKLCFGRTDPFNAEFERIAQTLLAPFMRHQLKEKK